MMEMILILIPDLWQFITLLGTMFFVIFFTPIFQRYILQMESFIMFPFVCKKCCSFWISITINIILAYIWTPMFFVWGLITSFALAYAHYYSDKMFG